MSRGPQLAPKFNSFNQTSHDIIQGLNRRVEKHLNPTHIVIAER